MTFNLDSYDINILPYRQYSTPIFTNAIQLFSTIFVETRSTINFQLKISFVVASSE